MDHIGHMPNAYLCALDQLGNGDRTASRLAGLIDHYERATGLQSSPELAPEPAEECFTDSCVGCIEDCGAPIGD